MTKIEYENFKAIANSNISKAFVTIDGQALRPDSVFYILGSTTWTPDYTHMLGTDGMPDGSPEMFRLNLEERLAVGDKGDVVSLRGHALNLDEPVVMKPSDNGEGYNYISAQRMSRLVYSTWYGPIPDCMEVDHMNRKRDDDRLCNLRLVTHSQNLMNRSPVTKTSWLMTDRVMLIPVKSGDPMLIHPSKAYAVVRDFNTWKLLHGQRRTANGWGAIVNPTPQTVRGHFEAYDEFRRDGLLEKCLALVS